MGGPVEPEGPEGEGDGGDLVDDDGARIFSGEEALADGAAPDGGNAEEEGDDDDDRNREP